MRSIKDIHTKAPISRQRKYQKRREAKGLCIRCGLLPRYLTHKQCLRCYVNHRLSAIGLFDGGVRNPWTRRRDRLILYAVGVFHGATHNTTKPFLSWQQAAAVVERHFFADVAGRWKGRRMEQFGRWLYRWDNRLRKGRD